MRLTKLISLAVVALLVSVTAYSVGEGSWECLWDDATCDAEFQHLWGSSTGGLDAIQAQIDSATASYITPMLENETNVNDTTLP